MSVEKVIRFIIEYFRYNVISRRNESYLSQGGMSFLECLSISTKPLIENNLIKFTKKLNFIDYFILLEQTYYIIIWFMN